MYKTIDAILGGGLFILLLLGFLVAGGGCGGKSVSAPKNPLSMKKKEWKPGPRCRLVGALRGKYMNMLIERNCLQNGATTVTVHVNNTAKDGKKAAEEFIQGMRFILGFTPALAPLVITKIKGKPIFIFIVVEK